MSGKVCMNVSVGYVFLLVQKKAILLPSIRATYNQAQGSAAFGINQEQGRDGKNDLNGTVSE